MQSKTCTYPTKTKRFCLSQGRIFKLQVCSGQSKGFIQLDSCPISGAKGVVRSSPMLESKTSAGPCSVSLRISSRATSKVINRATGVANCRVFAGLQHLQASRGTAMGRPLQRHPCGEIIRNCFSSVFRPFVSNCPGCCQGRSIAGSGQVTTVSSEQ